MNLAPQVNTPNIETSPTVSADFPAFGSYLIFARNDTAGWNTRFKLYTATVIPNIEFLSSRTPEGPWTPVSATFRPLSADSCQSEVNVSPASTATFLRLVLNANTGTIRFTSAEKFGTKARVRYEWLP